MSIQNIASSLFILFMLCGCDNRAEPIVEEEEQIAPQEQYEQGHIETHSTQ